MYPLVSLGWNISRLGVSAPTAKSVSRPMQVHSRPQRYLSEDMTRLRSRSTTMQSMREFFMHPLTWDRNNGYLNVLLSLALFSFCFINSCTGCPDNVEERNRKPRRSD